MRKEVASTKNEDDLKFQAVTVQALAHYYKHGDSAALLRLVLKLPKANRRTALLKWVQEFTVLRWDPRSEKLIRSRIPEIQRMDEAHQRPFWTFKIKQERRRHVSGNTFEAELFFERIFFELDTNIEKVPQEKLEVAIDRLNELLDKKRSSKVIKSFK